MERRIGEIFEHKGEWYQCVEGGTCSECSFRHVDCSISNIGDCTDKRTDGETVIFKKLEKVGEPFTCNYYGDGRLLMMQEYRAYDNRIAPINGIAMYVTDEKRKRVAIEIKQKENMEEKKDTELSNLENTGKNLKPFDLEAARNGKPVCTRDGRSARIVCFDRKGYNMFPIVALIMNGDRENDIYTYRPNGTWYNSVNESDKDLMMLPEKHEGWINVIKNQDNYYYCKGVFDTEEYARNNEANYTGLAVATVKIEWEE